MIAIILNSGMGSRLGVYTEDRPKCMVEILEGKPIIEYQLEMLRSVGISRIIITTGYMREHLETFVKSIATDLSIEFVYNPQFDKTNYIKSIDYISQINEDVILMHGDLVFSKEVLEKVISFENSCMIVDKSLPLPEKDFKAQLQGHSIKAVGINYFDENSYAAQPLYKLLNRDWAVWKSEIHKLCESGNDKVYAEEALNNVTHSILIKPIDIQGNLCSEIDNEEDLLRIRNILRGDLMNKKVYIAISADILHQGHINLINKAAEFGELTVGVLTDEAVASYKRYPLLDFNARKMIISNIKGVKHVIAQRGIDYVENLEELKPDYVIHGDDWIDSIQSKIRERVIETLKNWDGALIEIPYTQGISVDKLSAIINQEGTMPELRRVRLHNLLSLKPIVRVMEAHNGISALVVENAKVVKDESIESFDAMWLSSLTDSTAKGKPDIELVDMTSRIRTINEIMEVTTKPIILDGDTGGLIEHFVYNVKTLERMGVSAIIIEDKIGLKKNSLFGTEVLQTQDTIEHFSEKIRTGRQALQTPDFMIIARIESLILKQGMEDAIERAKAYIKAGAHGIMIHSREKEPDEIFEFCDRYQEFGKDVPLVVVPTAFNKVYEDEFAKHGVSIVIYANQLIRSAYPAMMNTAKMILENERCHEADKECMPIKEILTLIPGGN